MNRHRQRGFTLLELVIVIALIGVLGAVIGPVLRAGFDTYFDARLLADRERQASVALERFVREIRMADGIDSATAADIQFTRDGGATAVEFRFDGGRMERRADGGGWTPVAEHVDTNESAFHRDEINDVEYATMVLRIDGIPLRFQTSAAPR